MIYYNTLVLAFFVTVGCANNPQTTTNAELAVTPNAVQQSEKPIQADLDAKTFQTQLTENNAPFYLIDVRTPEEFQKGQLNGAINLNFYDEAFEQQLDTLNKDVPVYVYCASGGRSGKTKTLLHDKGFVAVYNLIGGYNKWPYKN